jgi:hypothetical protein
MDFKADIYRKRRNFRRLAMVCFGAGLLTYIQISLPIKGLGWDFIWLVYLGLAESVTEPFTKNLKAAKRVLSLLAGVILLIGFFAGLMQVGKMFGINQALLMMVPWFAAGFVFLTWSFRMHEDTLPD